MLKEEIGKAQRLVRTDAYQMSLGEIVSMYEAEEFIIHPEFQRLFRWSVGQKSRLIESLLLGIPLPPIFVFEKEDSSWELIDGLQRISSVLEFMGLLKTPEGDVRPPSFLEGTKYLPSLHNAVWDQSESIDDLPFEEQQPIDKSLQLAIRRARVGVEILKRPSDNQTKFDLFQRLNAGGTVANAQELRNCVMLMVNEAGFRLVKAAAEARAFLEIINATEDQVEKQRHMELASRFLVLTSIKYDGTLDVEEFIDEGIVNVLERRGLSKAIKVMTDTFELLHEAAGQNALRRFEGTKPIGKVGLVGLEGIAVGVASNLASIQKKRNAAKFVKQRIHSFWTHKNVESFTSLGLRGTIRLQRTVPFGIEWFS